MPKKAAGKGVTRKSASKCPHWLEPGRWAYEPGTRRYWFVLNVDKKNGTAYMLDKEQPVVVQRLAQARIESWTLEQAPFSVKAMSASRLLEGERSCAVFQLFCAVGSTPVYSDGSGFIVSPDDLARHWIQIDGYPAGVPKHINTVIDQWVI